MQKCRSVTDSAAYAVQFGGVWLEYHERIENAERELSTTKFICDEVTAERDALLAEKFVLERKFKDSIASLTQTETNHMEAKQIVDKVREEQKDLARRCLASEAHTEWLEDQVKQLKSHRSIKEEEIASLQFRIENLKSSVADGVSAQDALKTTLAQRDNEIATLKNLLKSRDEEILVQSRSLHSKDRQLAQMLKERNAFKDDLTDTQRALALARRTSAVNRKTASVNVSITATASDSKGARNSSQEGTTNVNKVDRMNVSSESTGCEAHDTTVISQPSTTSNYGSNHSSNHSSVHSSASTVLRRYKTSLHSRPTPAGYTISDNSVLLEDILMSVISPESNTLTNHMLTDDGCIMGSNSVNSSMELVNEVAVEHLDINKSQSISNNASGGSAEHIMTTPIVTRKSPLTLSDATTDLATMDNLHLDELDLDYIDTILNSTPGTVETVVKGRAGGKFASTVDENRCVSNGNIHSLSDKGVEDCGVVQKALFAASPASKRSNSNRNSVHTRAVNDTTSRNSMNVVGTTAGSIANSKRSIASNPWAVHKPVVRKVGSINNTPVTTNTATITNTPATNTTTDLSDYLERERDYKSALYLLQEEVRLLRSQVAGFEAAKRSIRGTPKKKTMYSIHTSAAN